MPEPEKRFTVTFSTEADEFQGRLFASGVMRILGMVQGNIATGSRWNGDVNDLAGNKIGEWTTAWRSDPRPGVDFCIGNDHLKTMPSPRKRAPSPCGFA